MCHLCRSPNGRDYLFAHIRGERFIADIRASVPGLFGYHVWPDDTDLADAVARRREIGPIIYFVEDDHGRSQAPELNLRRLSLSEIQEPGGDNDDLLETDVVFYGGSLGYEGSLKRFVSEVVETRRPTLREWSWSALMTCRGSMHTLRFKVPTGQDASSFGVQVFAPAANVVRRESPQQVSTTIKTDVELMPGHGWKAT